MDKETLSNYGWIVICVLVLAVMIALATPFGTFIAEGFNSAKQGLFDTGDSAMGVALGAVGVCEHEETEVRNATVDYSGDTVCKKCDNVLEIGKFIVPEGATYTRADGTVLNAGDEMPETIVTGDIYTYGNYEYRYNKRYVYPGYGNDEKWPTDENQNGWGVCCINRYVADPGAILETINGKPITCMSRAFSSFTSLKVIPEIPSSVTNMNLTFYNCTSLTTAPVIPSSVTNMDATFYNCTSLTGEISIPCSLASENYSYYNCPATITYYHVNGCTGACGK